MAISKTQPMRPAEIALIDASNQHEQTLNTHTQRLNSLDAGLAAETSNRESADSALSTRINNEVQARTNADTALGARIDGEIQARTNADNALGTRIDGEILARTNADSELSTRIDNETQARADGDAALQEQIGEGFSPSLTIAQSLSATNTAITNGDAALQGQIGEGFSPSLTIAQSLNTTNTAVSNIETEIGSGFDTQNTITSYVQALDLFLGTRTDLNDTVVNSILALASTSNALETFANRFKIGYINNVTIPANDSVSNSESFAGAFTQNDVCIVLGQVITSEVASLFTYTLTACTYSGFSYSIANSDADAHTVALGYVAVKVN